MKTAITRSGISLFPPSPLVTPASPLLSFPLSPFCHSRRFLAGIQCLSLLSFHSFGPHLGTARGFPIENVGNGRGGSVAHLGEALGYRVR